MWNRLVYGFLRTRNKGMELQHRFKNPIDYPIGTPLGSYEVTSVGSPKNLRQAILSCVESLLEMALILASFRDRLSRSFRDHS